MTYLRLALTVGLALLMHAAARAEEQKIGAPPEASNMRLVGYDDLQGRSAYQPTIHHQGDRWIAYIGHHGGTDDVAEPVNPITGKAEPNGTSIIDVSDPAKPTKVAEVKTPEGTLSHKVRVENGIMLVNREIYPIGRKDPDFKGGLEVFDITKPASPRHIGTWPARGMHRFTFDGRYVYGSPELDGYLGNVVSIIDFKSPSKPEEVGRWWMPGQWTEGGEKPKKAGSHRP